MVYQPKRSEGMKDNYIDTNRLNLYTQKEEQADENYIDKIACIHQLEVNEK